MYHNMRNGVDQKRQKFNHPSFRVGYTTNMSNNEFSQQRRQVAPYNGGYAGAPYGAMPRTGGAPGHVDGHSGYGSAEYGAPMAMGANAFSGIPGTMMYPMAPGNGHQAPAMYHHPYMPSHHAYGNAPYIPHAPTTDSGSGWSTRVASDGSFMPNLVRRGSISSNEEPHPSTPYNAGHGYGGQYNTVAIMDRSPRGAAYPTNTSTPSPSQFLTPGYGMPKYIPPAPISMQISIALKKEPVIPPAIPAPSSPAKPLDRCLENKNGETNVYIRGLCPETNDETLAEWGSRFGDIQSSKAIIDHKTGMCKGFGFIKYHNFDDAENCIRAFHYLGYEVSFARESFYSKLKKFSDEGNTNLYVSNIPRNYNEHELSKAFEPYKVCSSRILRDDRGNGRGVGFARFESREICEQVIKQFNNTKVQKAGGEEHVIQIRYSDTHEQKMLKQQTAAARQFRAVEFEFGCMQTGRTLPPASSIGQLHAAAAFGATIPSAGLPIANEFESYMQQQAQAGSSSYSQGLAPRRGNGAFNGNHNLPTIKSETSFQSDNSPLRGNAVKVEDTDAPKVSTCPSSPAGSDGKKCSPAKSETD